MRQVREKNVWVTFGADKQYWEKKGVNPCKLLNDTYLNPHTGRYSGVNQTMLCFQKLVNISAACGAWNGR